MLQRIKNRKESGFTIIEVLIVLAIAGLIMLIVFLAVPALQRNTRNNGRKNDESRFATALNNFVSNNNGALPGWETGSLVQATWQTDCQSIAQDAGTMNQYGTSGSLKSWCDVAGVLTANKVEMIDGSSAAQTITSNIGHADALVVVAGAQCGNPNTGESVNTVTGTSRQAALVYTQENTATNWGLVCQNIE